LIERRPALRIGIFQLLPVPEAVTDREVVEQALWEGDFAEAHGFDSVWVTEHHLSRFGLVGAPSVYAAALAQRTRRIDIGYAVAVVPLHHPLRLLEEILWVDQLSQGRLLVGVGPGFSPYEFGAFGVDLNERHALLEEGLRILRAGLASPTLEYRGTYWTVPPVRVQPRPVRNGGPTLMRACSSRGTLQRAAEEGSPVMVGLKSLDEIGEFVSVYRSIRSKMGRSPGEVDREVAEFRVLRRVCLDEDENEAISRTKGALAWERDTARRVHEQSAGTAGPPTLADGSASMDESILGGLVGTPDSVLEGLYDLDSLGIRHVIAWLNFGNMAYERVRHSMDLLASEVIPNLPRVEPVAALLAPSASR
jgi:alkanesulfonate monooxygenase SsuD/methylene tetrahydromethanopterin reductase-like flavin-dependent oxidoreductase (luciferase family)